MDAVLDFLVPEFDVAAPVLLPVLVEVKEDVQAAIEMTILDEVEVDVYIEVSARTGLVDAATGEFGVRDDSGDLECVGQEVTEVVRCEHVVGASGGKA